MLIMMRNGLYIGMTKKIIKHYMPYLKKKELRIVELLSIFKRITFGANSKNIRRR